MRLLALIPGSLPLVAHARVSQAAKPRRLVAGLRALCRRAVPEWSLQ